MDPPLTPGSCFKKLGPRLLMARWPVAGDAFWCIVVHFGQTGGVEMHAAL